MSRVAALTSSVHALEFPYTYDLIKGPTDKRKARKQIGSMAVEIVTVMRDELMHAACVQYLRSRGLTIRQIDVIFRGDNGTREVSLEHSVDRFEERSSETKETFEEAATSSIHESDRDTANQSVTRLEGNTC